MTFTKILLVCSVALIASLSGVPESEARVFNINDEIISSYFKGTGGLHVLEGRALSGSGDANAEHDIAESNYLYGGEVGFTLSSQSATVRLGYEYLKTLPTTAKGESAAGTHVYDIQSELTALIPKVGLDMHIKQWTTSRLILSFDLGQATISLANKFELTSAGETDYGISDFTENGEVTANLIEVKLGYEHLLADTTTFLVDIGYRQLSTTQSPKVTQAYTGFDGAVSKGTELLDEGGNARKINLNGVTLGIAFRFYL